MNTGWQRVDLDFFGTGNFLRLNLDIFLWNGLAGEAHPLLKFVV